MKTRIAAGLVVLAVAMLSLAAVAFAATGQGKLDGYKYDTSTKSGHITLKNSKGTKRYKMTAATGCGEHRGDSGGPLPCKAFAKSKYHGKHFHVTYKLKGNTRVASLVVVDL